MDVAKPIPVEITATEVLNAGGLSVDATTAAVLGLEAFRAKIQPDSRAAKDALAELCAFSPAQHAAWAHEISRTRDVDRWVDEEPQPVLALRETLRELPRIERAHRKLSAGEPLEEPEFFRVKQFLFYSVAALRAAAPLLDAWQTAQGWAQQLSTLTEQIHPQPQPTPRFHLASALDPRLGKARKALRHNKHNLNALRDELEAALLKDYPGHFDLHGNFTPATSLDPTKINALGSDPRLQKGPRAWSLSDSKLLAAREQVAQDQAEVDKLEAAIRARLSRALGKYLTLFVQVETTLIALDLRLAKARLRREIDGCWADWRMVPGIVIEQGREPNVEASHKHKDQKIQPVDLHLDARPAVITGPNMGGKSVLLRLIGLAQWCAQAALPVPARACAVAPVDTLIYVGAEEPHRADTMDGLSSFGREVRRLVEFWDVVHSADSRDQSADSRDQSADHINDGQGHSPHAGRLWLLDEIGRGTHPEEGAEIAAEIIARLAARGERVVAATHFPRVAALKNAQRFRIAGLKDPDKLQALLADKALDVHAALSQAMDYRPIPEHRTPHADSSAPPDGARPGDICPNNNVRVPRDARLVARALGLKLDDPNTAD